MISNESWFLGKPLLTNDCLLSANPSSAESPIIGLWLESSSKSYTKFISYVRAKMGSLSQAPLVQSLMSRGIPFETAFWLFLVALYSGPFIRTKLSLKCEFAVHSVPSFATTCYKLYLLINQLSSVRGR